MEFHSYPAICADVICANKTAEEDEQGLLVVAPSTFGLIPP